LQAQYFDVVLLLDSIPNSNQLFRHFIIISLIFIILLFLIFLACLTLIKRFNLFYLFILLISLCGSDIILPCLLILSNLFIQISLIVPVKEIRSTCSSKEMSCRISQISRRILKIMTLTTCFKLIHYCCCYCRRRCCFVSFHISLIAIIIIVTIMFTFVIILPVICVRLILSLNQDITTAMDIVIFILIKDIKQIRIDCRILITKGGFTSNRRLRREHLE